MRIKAAGTILVVDDEEAVRKLVHTLLDGVGYENVLEADGPDRAVEIAAKYQQPIHLLISDIVLGSDVNGMELARTITDLRPDTHVLLMSGHSPQPLKLEAGWKFIAKPFAPSEFLIAVRQMLELVNTQAA
jgi:two-component system cell cycle sensor histidine kinase/response regulator CckA